MGLFGGKKGGSNGIQTRSPTDMLIEQQYKQNQAEIESKKRDIYQQRLDIIKSQGAQSWTPRR